MSLRDYICENSESESESTTWGASMDRFDLHDHSSDSDSSSGSSRSNYRAWNGGALWGDSSSSRSSLSLNVFDN